ncbi:MAG: DNA-directed RNA polymerase subunit beta' [Candidatus Dormibacteraeota bacterium]|uniref:DNA-directed RNA polymerase subunit beta' n=1 Tax=Candidatus Amunia macphersoniae TaxID=3127014 RepID=A0A934KJH2_9BACT|nr:DNA-directed RNA polymerase subunit beta' [Candidatus Dormibacteraeota bacterium]
MLKLENFDALRLSIASPEMILSWSHGEVTKPETINYRTLKPERDGLFCEKIFGPTKDWECHCGKYKRYRYKGIICDKCGVEVTRSKVRRERMGHIKLASPVSHVWYFKGIPSRMGLLLDMSPRNLEKVLYFANYIVTAVDEKARTELVARLDPDTDARVVALREKVASGDPGQEDELAARIAQRQASLAGERSTLEGEREQRLTALRESARDLDERIQEAKGRKAVAAMALTDGKDTETVVTKGTALDEDVSVEVQRRAGEREEELTAQFAHRLTDVEDAAGAEMAGWRAELEAGRAGAEDSGRSELEALRADIVKQREELEALTVRDLLTDTQYREHIDRYGKVFKAGIGAAAVRELLNQIDLAKEALRLREESKSTSGQRRQKAIKRLRVVEAFRKSSTAPSWMVLDVLPVIPPELRPMVQLDGGRFATSDLNDLYRRVINRNNRLKRLLELGAPEIIVRNEKRMLQEAVDALIDNGRRGRAITGTGNRKLKSLSDMLKGKQGRFRQNLLGKRVDYSGRSVIVVGPELKLHQCGLPKKMALELFKPFVMRELVSQNFTQNIKSAKRMVERVRPEVWDVLDQVITDHPVLLNRAPTLHRLGIQAFMPVLVEGQAIQIHPLVCKAFNADFDGDQMAVHVPLFSGAVAEAKNLMMSSNNILSASDGRPVVTPSQDIVLGSYYLTQEMTAPPTAVEEVRKLQAFASPEEAELAYEHNRIALHDHVRVRMPRRHVEPSRASEEAASGTSLVTTTVGRVLFNAVLPLGEQGSHSDVRSITFRNEVMDLRKLGQLVKECYDLHGSERTAQIVNEIKRLGFHYATKAGVTVSAMDIKTPGAKAGIIAAAEKMVEDVDLQYRRGLITDDERYLKTVEIWTKATDDVTEVTMRSFDRFHSVLMMSQSGARGSTQQIRQIAGMRGLMADPTGRIIDLPIKANFSEGLNVLEYFISTHGARKGLADTALRTADSGYLTRRLVDVAQDVIVRIDDCETTAGIWVDLEDPLLGDRTIDRIAGRIAAQDVVVDDQTAAVAGEEISDEAARRVFTRRESVPRVRVRSIMTCKAREGVCRLCYGRNLATGRLVEIGEAVGVIAAQSIGEPGTQLTMRTFHTGGVATGGSDITQGLPRVEELFEARVPKGKALISETDGDVEIIRTEAKALKVKVTSRDVFDTTYPIPPKFTVLVTDGEVVAENAELVRGTDENGNEVTLRAKYAGVVKATKNELLVRTTEEDAREYPVPVSAQVIVHDGDRVVAGDRITQGSISPQELLLVRGREDVQNYLVREVQSVYRSQGVDINDKHIEVIVRQMMRKVRVDNAGDTDLLPGEIVSQFEWEESNAKALSEGGEPAIAGTVLLGLIKAALNTASWLSAASFQETTRVLTEAAISGKIDKLRGLKENVIIGKLIPAGTGLDYYQKLREEAARLYEEEEAAAALAELAAANEDDEDDEDDEDVPSAGGVSEFVAEEVPTATA